MAYINVWSSASPLGSTTLSINIDEEIRKVRVDIEQRVDHIIGNSNWSSGVDPVIDGVTVKSLFTLTSELATKPSINTTNNTIPKRLSSTAFTNSNINDSGTLITLGSNIAVTGSRLDVRGIQYTWPAAAADGQFLQYNAGVLSWVTLNLSGTIGGSGTAGQLAAFVGATEIGNSGVTAASGTITGVSGNFSGAFTALQLYGTSSVTAPNFLQTGAGNSIVAQGFISAAVSYKISSDQVIGPRITGWGVPTGSSSKGAFDTATVDHPTLAQVVAELIKNLQTHGVIGT